MENSILSDDFWQDMPGTFVAIGSESDKHEAGVHTGCTVDVRWKSPVEKLSLGPWGSFSGKPRRYGDGSKPWYLVNPKIAGKWMFIPLKMYL
jgi:hypothetical protein